MGHPRRATPSLRQTATSFRTFLKSKASLSQERERRHGRDAAACPPRTRRSAYLQLSRRPLHSPRGVAPTLCRRGRRRDGAPSPRDPLTRDKLPNTLGLFQEKRAVCPERKRRHGRNAAACLPRTLCLPAAQPTPLTAGSAPSPARTLSETNCPMFQGSPKKRGQFVQSARRGRGRGQRRAPPQPRRSAYLQLCRRPLHSTRGARSAARVKRRSPNGKRAAHNGARAASTRPCRQSAVQSRCIPRFGPRRSLSKGPLVARP